MKQWWNKKSRICIQLRFDEFPDNFPDISKPSNSADTTSEVKTFAETFQNINSKSMRTVSDSSRSTGGLGYYSPMIFRKSQRKRSENLFI